MHHVSRANVLEALMTRRILVLVALAAVTGCGGRPTSEPASAAATGATPATPPVETSATAPKPSSQSFAEGKDYVVVERVRILDSEGFDQPVEAMSVLLPRGWQTQAGVRWRGVNECRGEMINWSMASTSPDGAIRFDVLPVRSFGWQEDPMLQQAALQAAQQGGCPVSQPFDAGAYLQHLAQQELGGATVESVRPDQTLESVIQRISADANATAQRFGTGLEQSGSGVYASLAWPDGSKGIANIGVMVSLKRGRDQFSGRPNGFASSMVFHQAVIRFPADRQAEAVRIFGMALTSHRVNPVWQRAKDNFLTQLGNIEHAGRMERLRLQGEQSAAYAKAQSEASDQRMRDWELRQASSDRQQSQFIQTIREVETWRDSGGTPVELSAGYSHGWSRPDGSYILTNNSLFDPAVALQQNWTRMEKTP